MSHGDRLTSLPDGFIVVAKTENAPFASIAHLNKPIYGIQFHPEVTHSPQGREVIRNFVVDICRCNTNWTMASSSVLRPKWWNSEFPLFKGEFIDKEIARIREVCGPTGQVIGAVSGGVD